MCQTHTLQKMSNISHLKDKNRSLRFFWSPSSIILLMFFSIWKCIISYMQIIKTISNYSNITAWIPFIYQSSTGGFEYFVSKKQKTKTKKQGRILTESWKSNLHHFKQSWGKKADLAGKSIKTAERISRKSGGKMGNEPRKNPLTAGADPDEGVDQGILI